MQPKVIDITALFKEVADRVNNAIDDFDVFFDYGHYKEITRNLAVKEGVQATQDKKYPLIWLVMDFIERYGDNTEYCELPDVTIIIATRTIQDSTTPERIETNFVPILYKIYGQLLKEIEDSGFFSGIDWAISHEKIDRPYWDGKENQVNAANLFDDYIDAIQIRRLNLIVNMETCNQFRLIG